MFIKIIIQTLILLCVADIVWLIVMVPTWSHTDASDKNDYWKSLSGMHTFVIIFAFLELILKGLTVAYLVYDFKTKNPEEVSELWKLSYLQNLQAGQSKNEIINTMFKILLFRKNLCYCCWTKC